MARDHGRDSAERADPAMLERINRSPKRSPHHACSGRAFTGMAAAPGQASGRAQVILDPSERTSNPARSSSSPPPPTRLDPLFLTAAGPANETGPAMAHGHTVAREYGIPAVICDREATQLITTGQMITNDGAAGTVLITDDNHEKAFAAPPERPHT